MGGIVIHVAIEGGVIRKAEDERCRGLQNMRSLKKTLRSF